MSDLHDPIQNPAETNPYVKREADTQRNVRAVAGAEGILGRPTTKRCMKVLIEPDWETIIHRIPKCPSVRTHTGNTCEEDYVCEDCKLGYYRVMIRRKIGFQWGKMKRVEINIIIIEPVSAHGIYDCLEF